MAVLKAKKNSPHIFFVGGIAGVLTSTVLACKATLKLEDVLDEAKEDIGAVKALGEGSRAQGTTYIDKEYHRDLGYVYGKTAFNMTRLYGPAAFVGIVSIAALTGSHVQLARRNTALTVTLAAVSKAYEEYRMRVQEEIGLEKELDIYRDVRDVEVEIDGKKATIQVANQGTHSPYARLFAEHNINWENSAEHNYMFVKAQQSYANDKLKSRGHVFLNEIYDTLGIEHSQAGAVVGWVYNGDGDNFIDFGIKNNPEFAEGRDKNVWLDFNVDGVIYDKI